nr:PEP/pyruvate-binding domain-containing protein [Phytoactinopolyspora halotolerans]
MVYGNLGLDSGTGVAFTRDPATGKPGIYGDYLQDAQGEDVVAGIRNWGVDMSSAGAKLRDVVAAIIGGGLRLPHPRCASRRRAYAHP